MWQCAQLCHSCFASGDGARYFSRLVSSIKKKFPQKLRTPKGGGPPAAPPPPLSHLPLKGTLAAPCGKKKVSAGLGLRLRLKAPLLPSNSSTAQAPSLVHRRSPTAVRVALSSAKTRRFPSRPPHLRLAFCPTVERARRKLLCRGGGGYTEAHFPNPPPPPWPP